MPEIITDFKAIKRAAIGLRNTFPKDEIKPVRERPERLASYLAQIASDRAQWEKYLEKYVAPLKDGA